MTTAEFVRTEVARWDGCSGGQLVNRLHKMMLYINALADQGRSTQLTLLGMALRHCCALEALVAMLQREDRAVQAAVLLLLGNITSENLDPKVAATRERLRPLGVIPLLVPHLVRRESTDAEADAEAESMKLYALGALMNICADGKDSTLDPGGSTRALLLPELERLATSTDALPTFSRSALM